MSIGKYVSRKLESAKEARKVNVEEHEKLEKIEARARATDEKRLHEQRVKIQKQEAILKGKQKAQSGSTAKGVIKDIKTGAKITTKRVKKAGKKIQKASTAFAEAEKKGDTFSLDIGMDFGKKKKGNGGDLGGWF